MATKHSADDARQKNGKARSKTALTVAKLAATDVKQFAHDLPAMLQKEVQANPLRALGIAAAVGFGGGVAIGSRLARGLVGSVAIYALGRGLDVYVKRALDQFVSGFGDRDAELVP